MDAKPKNKKDELSELNEDKIKEIKKQNEEDQSDKLQYKQLILIILITVIMVLASLGLSLAIVRMLSGSKNMNFNTIMIPIKPVPGKPGQTDDDDFIFSYKEKETLGNGIYIENMFPTTDEVGRELVGEYNTFEFSLYYGTKSKNKYYEITAEMTDECTLGSENVKVYLESDGEVLDNVIKKNGRVKTFAEYENATVDKKNNREKLIYGGKISESDISRGHKDFTLKMWFSEDAPLNNQTMNKRFVIKINVYAK